MTATLAWAPVAPAEAAPVYEITGEWKAGTPNVLQKSNTIESLWRFNVNDDSPAPSNDPVENMTVAFQVQNGTFTAMPEECLVDEVDPVSAISADGTTLTCNLGTRDQGTAELMLTGILVTGDTGSVVNMTGTVGGVQSVLPDLPINNPFAMDIRFDGLASSTRASAGGSYKLTIPWSLRHTPGAEAGPNSISYDVTISGGGALITRHAEACAVASIPRMTNHPRSDSDAPDDARAPFVESCTLTQISPGRFRLTLTGIDYSKVLLPTKSSAGNSLPSNWDVVAAGQISFNAATEGGVIFEMVASTPTYTSVFGSTSRDDASNNLNRIHLTGGTHGGGWVLGGLNPPLPGRQWVDSSRAMAGSTVVASNVLMKPGVGQTRSNVMCHVIDNKYVEFVDAVVGALASGAGTVPPNPGVTYEYYVGNGAGNVLNPNHSAYNPNAFSCATSGWTTEKPADVSTIRAVRATFPPSASGFDGTSWANLYVFSRVKDDVKAGQDIWAWNGYLYPEERTTWYHPHREMSAAQQTGSGVLTPGTRYPFTAFGRDLLRIVGAEPRVQKDVAELVSLPGATVHYTVKYRADGIADLPVPSYRLTDTLPAGATYVPGSASVAPSSVSGGKITWNFTNLTPNTNEDYVLTYSVRLPETAAPGTKLTNTVVADVSGFEASDTADVRIPDGGFVQLTKNVAADKVSHESGVANDSWTVRMTSHDAVASTFTDTIDLLPYNGDGRGTSFNGGYKLSEAVQAVAGSTVYYTTADPATLKEDPAHASNGRAGNAAGNTVGWSTTFNPEATAVRVIGPRLAPGGVQEFTLKVTTVDAQAGDRYVNRAESRAQRTQLLTRTSSEFEIGAVNSVTLKKYVQDAEGAWHDANDIDDYPSYRAGDKAPYRIVVTNTGDQVLKNLVITDDKIDLASIDPLPAGLTLNDEGVAVIAELQPGEANAVTIEYSVDIAAGSGGSSIVNTACVVPEASNPDAPEGSLENAEEDCDPAGLIVLPSSLAWEKIAEGTSERLSGSEWTLTPIDAEGEPTGDAIIVTDCIEDSASDCSDADRNPEAGQFLIDPLDDGRYRLIETRAPAGYQLDSTPRDIDVVGAVVLEDPITNKQSDVPELPLTGGTGTLVFLLGAGVLGALIAAGLVLQRRRSLRVTL